MGNWWTPDFDSSSTSPSSTRPSSPGIAQNTSNEGTHSGSTRLDEDFPNEQILTPPNLTFPFAGLETAIRNFWREREMGDSWIPHFDSSSTSPNSTRPSSLGIAQNTSNEGTHLGTGSTLSTRLDEDFPNGQILTTPNLTFTAELETATRNFRRKQKLILVVQVDMHDAKSRTKTMKFVVGIPGVMSATIMPDRNQLKVVGDGVDPVNLTTLLRKHKGSKIERLLEKRKEKGDQMTRRGSDQREEKGKKDRAGVIIMADKGKSKVTDDVDRAQWSDGMRKCLIDICLEQVKSGGRPGIQFSSKAWKIIIKKFTQRTGHSFNKKQLKNQLDNLKKLYNASLHLTSQTGIGFNPHTGCVEMEQDRWTEYLKTHRDAKIFKSKPLPFPEEMAALFDGTSARGDDKWAPIMDGVPEDIITDMDSSFFNLNHDDDTPSLNLTNSRSFTLLEDSACSDIAADVMMANIRRKRPRPSKKQSMASNDSLNACITDLAASVKASNQLAITSVQSEGPTIDDCIDILNALPEISEASPLYLTALTCFMVKDKRTIWMRLRTDEGKMAWLKNQFQLEKENAFGSDSGL